MPIELATEAVLKSLGQVAGGAAVGGLQTAAPASPLTLTITTKVIDLVGKHLDRILDRFNPAQEPPGRVTGKQMMEKAQEAKAKGGAKPKPPEEKKPPAFKGAEIIEAFEVFIGLQDQNITLAQFGLWLDKNKEKLALAIDKIVPKI